jgi:hypothetical protein
MIYKEAEKFRIKLTVEAADTEPLTPSAWKLTSESAPYISVPPNTGSITSILMLHSHLLLGYPIRPWPFQMDLNFRNRLFYKIFVCIPFLPHCSDVLKTIRIYPPDKLSHNGWLTALVPNLKILLGRSFGAERKNWVLSSSSQPVTSHRVLRWGRFALLW